MPAIIRFTPYSGVKDEEPYCYLLEIDGFRILLDCGWFDFFDTKALEPLRRVAKTIDAILISHPDMKHLGAIPYAYAKLGLTCPVYATLPVFDMGKIFVVDAYLNRARREDFDLYTMADITAAFDEKRWVTLKYSQRHQFVGKGSGITITPYQAGHMIGGSIWYITKDTDEIMYAVNYNNIKDRHLKETAMLNFKMPSLLITDAYNASTVQEKRKQRDQALMETISDALYKRGNVLIPADSAGRVLELAFFLEQNWKLNMKNFKTLGFKLVLFARKYFNPIHYAQKMTEWMSDDASVFADSQKSPFEFENLEFCTELADLEKYRDPIVVLASSDSLETGPSRDIFAKWAGNEKNVVIFVTRGPPNSLTRKLVDNLKTDHIHLQLKKKIPLEGSELAEYNYKKMKENIIQKKASFVEDDSSSDEEDKDMDIEPLANTSGYRYDILLTDAAATGGFFKQSKHHPMFPVVEHRFKSDEYGEIIQPDDFVMASVPEVSEADKNKKDRMEMEEILPDIPSKCLVEEVDLTIKCTMKYIDFEGLADGRSIKEYLKLVAAKKMLIVGGSESATKSLYEAAIANATAAAAGRDSTKSTQVEGSIYVPNRFESIDASSTTNIFRVKMTDELVSSIKMSKHGDYELGYVNSLMKVEDDNDILLEPLPLASANDRSPLFIGEVSLAQFKSLLQKEGHQADFASGVLICDNEVAIRKTATGKVTIEGGLTENYFKIRDLLYQQYAIL